MTMKNTQDSEQPAIPPLPPAAGSAEMLELPNDTKIRFCNAFDQIKAHCILCKPCDLYLRWGDGDLCSTGKAMIALEMCYTDTSVIVEAKYDGYTYECLCQVCGRQFALAHKNAPHRCGCDNPPNDKALAQPGRKETL